MRLACYPRVYATTQKLTALGSHAREPAAWKPPPLEILDPLLLLLGDRLVTQQQLFSVKAYVYSSRSTSTQSSVDIPPLKGMGWKFLTVERAKTSMGRW